MSPGPNYFDSKLSLVLCRTGISTLFAYLLSAPEIRRHKRWFVLYLIMTSLFYTEFKNLIARVAVIKELMRERAWKVTPRTVAPKPAQQSEV